MGQRIGGGAAHSFYVGLETKRGDEAKALCLIPRGYEEGQTVELGGRTFNLTLGRPVQFPLFTSTSDRLVSSGEIVGVGDDLHPLPPIHTVLKNAEGKTGTRPVFPSAFFNTVWIGGNGCRSSPTPTISPEETRRSEVDVNNGNCTGLPNVRLNVRPPSSTV